MLTPVNHIDEFLPVIKSSFLSAGASNDLTKDNLLTRNLCLTDTVTLCIMRLITMI